jgi:hypothetical protein
MSSPQCSVTVSCAGSDSYGWVDALPPAAFAVVEAHCSTQPESQSMAYPHQITQIIQLVRLFAYSGWWIQVPKGLWRRSSWHACPCGQGCVGGQMVFCPGCVFSRVRACGERREKGRVGLVVTRSLRSRSGMLRTDSCFARAHRRSLTSSESGRPVSATREASTAVRINLASAASSLSCIAVSCTGGKGGRFRTGGVQRMA